MSDTKLCPFCAEEIKSAAIKCKHCGEMLESSAVPAPVEAPKPPGEISLFDNGQVRVTTKTVTIDGKILQVSGITSAEVRDTQGAPMLGLVVATIALFLGTLGLVGLGGAVLSLNPAKFNVGILFIGLLFGLPSAWGSVKFGRLARMAFNPGTYFLQINSGGIEQSLLRGEDKKSLVAIADAVRRAFTGKASS
jgi:hypothetical protein